MVENENSDNDEVEEEYNTVNSNKNVAYKQLHDYANDSNDSVLKDNLNEE